MSVWIALLVFLGSLALMSISGMVLTGHIERIGNRLNVGQGLLGILVALGADSPEISSAVSALAAGHRDVGVGVVLGSNVFNLAAILGLGAVVAKRGVRVGRRGLLLNGGVALVVSALAAALVFGWLPGWLGLVLLGVVVVPYGVISAFDPDRVARWPLPAPLKSFLCSALSNVERDTRLQDSAKKGAPLDALSLVPALAAVVLGGVGTVHAAVTLGDWWGVPRRIVGMIGLASLTGVPNAIAAVRLARHGRGAAVVSETFNSNTLNVVFGIALPSIILGASHAGTNVDIALAWLLGMTILTMVLTGTGGGLHEKGGAALLVLYAAFVVTMLII